MIVTEIGEKNQIKIPKKLLNKLGIKVGDKLLIEIENNKIILTPIRPEGTLENLSKIADKYLGGAKKTDAVKLVEESLNEEYIELIRTFIATTVSLLE